MGFFFSRARVRVRVCVCGGAQRDAAMSVRRGHCSFIYFSAVERNTYSEREVHVKRAPVRACPLMPSFTSLQRFSVVRVSLFGPASERAWVE